MKLNKNYRTAPFTKMREMIAEGTRQSKYYEHVAGFGEVDITIANEIMNRYYKKNGERLSFTAWVIKCIAKAIEEHKMVQGYRRGRKIIIFDDIDVRCNVEKEVDGQKVPIQYIIRKTNEKNVKEIHNEIRNAQKYDEDKDIYQQKVKKRQLTLMKLPKFIRNIIWHRIMTNPFKIKENFGTVACTAMGMFGKGTVGYVIPKTPFATSVAVGSIVKKPVYIENKFVPRDILHLTAVVNHDIVDGAVAVRFGIRLFELLSSAFGLEEFK